METLANTAFSSFLKMRTDNHHQDVDLYKEKVDLPPLRKLIPPMELLYPSLIRKPEPRKRPLPDDSFLQPGKHLKVNVERHLAAERLQSQQSIRATASSMKKDLLNNDEAKIIEYMKGQNIPRSKMETLMELAILVRDRLNAEKLQRQQQQQQLQQLNDVASPLTMERNGSYTSNYTPSKSVLTETENDNEDENEEEEEEEEETVQEAKKVKPKSVSCKICGSGFSRRANLNKHVRLVHFGERQHKCHFCPATFGQKSAADTHEKAVHLAIKSKRCPHCPKSFCQVGDLNRHIGTVHKKIRSFKCDHCPSSFGLKAQLTRHVRTVHEKQRPFECDCGASFGEKNSLKKHMQAKEHSSKHLALESESM